MDKIVKYESPGLVFLPDNSIRSKVDILLITGDAYIDHPSFGVAVIARVLVANGYSVCIASQPEYYNPDYLQTLPVPVLFIGITSGNLDSVAGNYTGNRNLRRDNAYSINGVVNFINGKKIRPDRALITYTGFIKQRFKDVPVVLGGLEASLRRFSHFDYVQNKIRKSVLIDSKADILVYGMGEKAILEIALRLREGQSINGVHGTMVRYREGLGSEKTIELPSYDEILNQKQNLYLATSMIESNMIPHNSSSLLQYQGSVAVISFCPQPILDEQQLDEIYNLPFKKDYPEYCQRVPAWSMINTSITTHRGCYGRCSFCAIAAHQGPAVMSRSHSSVIKEAEQLTYKSFFKGTISDAGGPTANMYGTSCKIGWCKDPHCLYPDICENLILNENTYVALLKKIKNTSGVKHIFVSSGIRYDIALLKKEETEWIIVNATSGHFKVAPEHTENEILALMKKPGLKVFIEFLDMFDRVKKESGLRFYVLPYIILSHPGSSDKSAEKMAKFLKSKHISTRQYQDFTPVPSTLSTAMYYSGYDPDGNKISVISPSYIKNSQREIVEKILNDSSKSKRLDP